MPCGLRRAGRAPRRVAMFIEPVGLPIVNDTAFRGTSGAESVSSILTAVDEGRGGSRGCGVAGSRSLTTISVVIASVMACAKGLRGSLAEGKGTIYGKWERRLDEGRDFAEEKLLDTVWAR